MFQFSTITLLNSLTDKSGQSLFNKEDDTLLFKGEGLYQVDEDHLIEMFKNEGHKEYRDIVDITNLEDMISDPTKIYRIEFYIESNANADPLFSNSLSRKSKTVFVEFNSIDSFYVNLNRFQTMTYGSQLLNLVGELDGEIADGKSTVTSANKTNQNNYLMASNCYIRVMNADVQQADDNGKFYSIGKLDIYHGSEGLGTQEDILKNYILPTGYNNRLSQILTTDQPLNGALYDQFIIRYFVNRGNLGIHAVGQQTITETLHCFWINQNESQEFEQTINDLIESGNKEKEPPTFMGLYYDDNNINIDNYKLGDPVMVSSNGDDTQPSYLFVTDEEKNKFTNIYITNEQDEETAVDLTQIFFKIDEDVVRDLNEIGLENAEQYIGLNLCTIPSLAYSIYNNQAKSAKYTYDGVEYNVTYLSTHITATFNVTSDSEKTQLYSYFYNEEADEEYWIRGVDMFDNVEIDGTDVSVTSLDEAQGMYQLNVGEHTVKYTLKDKTSISRKSFQYCSSITNVTIPNSVTEIGNNAFEGCSFTSIDIPNSVTSIGDRAFQYCSSLTSVTMPNSVTSIGSSAFNECRSLTSVIIPNSVTSIGDYTFNGCVAMTTCTIGNDSLLTSIGENAFYSCSSLTSINIPSGVTSIDSGVFNNCSSLSTVTMGDSVTIISDYAFSNCSHLTSINIPSSLETVGDYAFCSCNLLDAETKAIISNMNEYAFSCDY